MKLQLRNKALVQKLSQEYLKAKIAAAKAKQQEKHAKVEAPPQPPQNSQPAPQPPQTPQPAPAQPKAPKTKTATSSHYQNVMRRLKWLRKKYPKTFLHGQRLPLKVKVFHDLVAAHPEISKRQFRDVLRAYTNNWRYLTNIIEGTDRLDLTGAASGKVSASEAAHAIATLEARKSKLAA